MRPAVACLICCLAGCTLIHAQGSDRQPSDSSDRAAVLLLERFLSATDTLHSYRALRTLEATTRGGRMHARLTAWTSVDRDLGFQYSIVEEEGSGAIRSRVLHAALEAERSMRAAGDLSRGALTTENYEFTAAEGADDDGLVRLAIHPKRRDTMLVEGSMLLTADEGDLVRVEGLLIKRPSFWTRRVEVVRRYARIGDVRVPVSMESTAHVRLFGTSTFSMTYEYTSINGQLVPETEQSPDKARQ